MAGLDHEARGVLDRGTTGVEQRTVDMDDESAVLAQQVEFVVPGEVVDGTSMPEVDVFDEAELGEGVERAVDGRSVDGRIGEGDTFREVVCGRMVAGRHQGLDHGPTWAGESRSRFAKPAFYLLDVLHHREDRTLRGPVGLPDFEQLAVIHLAATGFMVGLIWTIHAVHYPLFAFVPEPYEPFQGEHMKRISRLLVIPWGIEVASALGLLLLADGGRQRSWSLVGGALVVAIVVVTGLLAAPAHGRLLERFDAAEHRSLMRIDLARTLLWTARGAVAIALVYP